MRKLFMALCGLMTLLLSIGLAAPALAQDAGGGSLRGTLRYEGDAVPGVTITVTGADDAEVGSTETDDGGAWEVPLPAAGDYTVTLDAETLPDGVPAPGTASQTRTADGQGPVGVIFNLGGPAAPDPGGEPTEDAADPDTDQGTAADGGTGADAGTAADGEEPVAGDEAGSEPVDVDITESEAAPGNSLVVQLLINGLRFGLILGLAALGLSLVFGTTGLTNFSHGELISLGAVGAFMINAADVPIIWAAVLVVGLAALFGWGQDRLFWRPLRKRKTGLVGMMIISIGVALVLRYLMLFLIGGGRRQYDEFVIQRRVDLGLFSIAPRDLIIMGICIVLLAAVAIAMVRTRMGKATRAISDNPALAASSGINVDRVITSVWVVGTALAALAGVFLGFVQQVDYLMGFRAVLLVFAAVVLGGLGTAWGAMIGALIIGVFIELSTLVVPSELKNAGVLFVLIVILLFRPQGLLGRRERIG